jgi:RNA polymerase sigma-70 factor (ECF subfamily)
MSDSLPGLLERLQQTGEQAAWERLVDMHAALLFLWGCRAGLQGPEAADLARDVLAAAASQLPLFRAGQPGGFHGWLRGLAHSQRRAVLAKRQPPAPATAVPDAADALLGSEYVPFILGHAVEFLKAEFPAGDWKAFWGLTVEGRPAADLARELGQSVAAVYSADARVVRRVRQELAGLVE